MIQNKFTIGQQVAFKHRGEPLVGLIVGTELVDDQRRGEGWHFFIRIATTELVDVPQSQIIRLADQQPVTT